MPVRVLDFGEMVASRAISYVFSLNPPSPVQFGDLSGLGGALYGIQTSDGKKLSGEAWQESDQICG